MLAPHPRLAGGRSAALLVALLAALAPRPTAAEHGALARLVARADNVVAGTVVARASDGARARVTVEGRSLENGRPIEVDLAVEPGREPGLLAPGAEVLVAYAWRCGGPTAPGNALLAGGLYRVERTADGRVVRGRGPGAAIERDVRLAALTERIRALAERPAHGR